MATTQSRLADLITALGTDYKGFNTKIGSLGGLNTTDKSSLVSAINEVRGNINGIRPTKTITASYTLTTGDAGYTIFVNNSTSEAVVTVPAALPAGFECAIVRINSGRVSVAPASGVNMLPTDTRAALKQGSPIYILVNNSTGPVLPTTDLAMRYRADDLSGADQSAVASWASAGGGNPLVQNTAGSQPVLQLAAGNGHKGVYFNGNKFMSQSGTDLDIARNKDRLLVVAVGQQPGFGVSGIRTITGQSNSVNTAQGRFALGQVNGAVHTMGGRRLDADSFQSVQPASGGAGPVIGESWILTGYWNWAARAATLYKNGTSIASTATFQSAAGKTSDTSALTGSVGGRGDGAEGFYGLLFELLFYLPSQSDITSLLGGIDSYAAATYGIQNVADATGATNSVLVSGELAL